MKITISLILILALSFLSFNFYDPGTNFDPNYDLLIQGPWKLKEIEVAGYSYTDSATTDMKVLFRHDGYCSINDDTTELIPWIYKPSEIWLAPYTADQQIWNINYLSEKILIYDVDYAVEDSTYNYVFKFVRQ